jgi:hypothetical protein
MSVSYLMYLDRKMITIFDISAKFKLIMFAVSNGALFH